MMVNETSDYRCPICDKRFGRKRALSEHLEHTKTHDSVTEELWRLRFLLAETERERDIYRGQRDAWRETAQMRRIA